MNDAEALQMLRRWQRDAQRLSTDYYQQSNALKEQIEKLRSMLELSRSGNRRLRAAIAKVVSDNEWTEVSVARDLDSGALASDLESFGDYVSGVVAERLAFAVEIVRHGPPGDHACAKCRPHSEILIDGFRCAFHRAKDLLGYTCDCELPGPHRGCDCIAKRYSKPYLSDDWCTCACHQPVAQAAPPVPS